MLNGMTLGHLMAAPGPQMATAPSTGPIPDYRGPLLRRGRRLALGQQGDLWGGGQLGHVLQQIPHHWGWPTGAF